MQSTGWPQSVAVDDFEFLILRPLPPKCWKYRSVPPHSATWEILKPVLSLLLKVKSVLKEPVSIKVSPVSLALLVQDPGSISNVEEKVTKLKLHRICTHVACLDSYKQDLSLVQNGLYASPFYF